MSVACPWSSVTDSSATRPSAVQIAVLPIEWLLILQKSQFHLAGKTIEVRNEAGAGYNVISNGQVRMDGQQYNLVNCIQSKVTLTSQKEYKDFQKLLLSKLMVFFATVKVTEGSTKVYAVIVNTRHPRMRQEIEDNMKDVTALEMGAKYVLQLTLQKSVQSYFSLKDLSVIHDRSLVFTCEYKSSDDFHGCTTKTKELNGNILDLSYVTEDEKCEVKKLLDKMSESIQANIGSAQSSGVVSSYEAGSSEDKVCCSTQPCAKRSSGKQESSLQLPAVNEKSYLLQFTQHLPRYIE
ncbi:testis-expressed protein 26 isoform X3 [Narcine bancroftii]|uniref:testis-expressed protein 26 isoform X3 n=1 Tax=Narcine bancroftii TaxID=1343680 RepID=UPI00383167F7